MEWCLWNSILFLEMEVNGFEGKFFVEVLGNEIFARLVYSSGLNTVLMRKIILGGCVGKRSVCK